MVDVRCERHSSLGRWLVRQPERKQQVHLIFLDRMKLASCGGGVIEDLHTLEKRTLEYTAPHATAVRGVVSGEQDENEHEKSNEIYKIHGDEQQY